MGVKTNFIKNPSTHPRHRFPSFLYNNYIYALTAGHWCDLSVISSPGSSAWYIFEKSQRYRLNRFNNGPRLHGRTSERPNKRRRPPTTHRHPEYRRGSVTGATGIPKQTITALHSSTSALLFYCGRDNHAHACLSTSILNFLFCFK